LAKAKTFTDLFRLAKANRNSLIAVAFKQLMPANTDVTRLNDAVGQVGFSQIKDQ